MKKALIHYFSGTGNSLLAAKQLRRLSIQASALRALVIIAASFISSDFLIPSIIPAWFIQSAGNVGSAIFNALMEVVLFIVTFALFDMIIYRISYIPAFKNVAAWGYTKLFGRYHADRFKDQFLNRN